MDSTVLPTTMVTSPSLLSSGMGADLYSTGAVPSSTPSANFLMLASDSSSDSLYFLFFSMKKPSSTGPLAPFRPKKLVTGSWAAPSLLTVTNTSLPLKDLDTALYASNTLWPDSSSAEEAHRISWVLMPELKILSELSWLNSMVRGSFSAVTKSFRLSASTALSSTTTSRASPLWFLMMDTPCFFRPAALPTASTLVSTYRASSDLPACLWKASKSAPDSFLK
mmetsp:Transcript_33321/g.84437  ORF Transcript_33321/g.84437 Transcript_33321/m.84437 type:complete len:223 (-) Transcript_33321:573-1241(-)